MLPPNEVFARGRAGAISLVVQRFAAALPGVAVAGRPRAETFARIDYVPAGGLITLAAAIMRRKPDMVIVHQQPRLAMFLALLFRRARVLLWLHNNPLAMRGLKTRVERRIALRLLDRVVCVSGYLADQFMTGLTGPRPLVLVNTLNLAELPPQPAVRAPCVLFAGRVVADKGPDVFISACKQALSHLPGWRARMIGGDRFGPDSPETGFVARMRAAADEAGVAFEGPQPHGAVLAAMAEAAIVVVPSRWAEPFGLTALEAMASGAALITSGQGGLREVAGDAACYVPADDAQALAAAILRLARDDQARAALATAGLARARQFDTTVQLPAWRALLNAA